MIELARSIRHFLVSEDGPTAVEYAVMISMILAFCIGAISTIGQTTNNKFVGAMNAMQ
ncbi:MAG: Flp family type IVb pilin [Planctomycetes bacterium]|nr:Flp family type IVb pilin [Planctomycetota bacterium]